MAQRDKSGRFLKGHKGVPGAGRSLGGVDIKNYILSISNGTQDYVDILDKLVRDTKNTTKERVICIKELLDRGLGRPAQHNINENHNTELPYSKVVEMVNKRIADDNST